MSSQSEVGHAKNVANFEDLISFCTGFGAAYNPGANNIKLAALNTINANCKAAITTNMNAFTAFKNATNAREIAFQNFRKMATRIVNALDACGAALQTIKDAKTLNTRMRGKAKKFKAGPEGTDVPATPATPATGPETPAPTENTSHSTSQQSYDSLLQHMAGLIQVVNTEPLYTPNENELKVTGLNAYLAGLQAKNTTCITTYTAYSNARINRDNLLYASKTGLCDVANEVKKYIKSVFGATSPQYRQLSALKFSKRKI